MCYTTGRNKAEELEEKEHLKKPDGEGTQDEKKGLLDGQPSSVASETPSDAADAEEEDEAGEVRHGVVIDKAGGLGFLAAAAAAKAGNLRPVGGESYTTTQYNAIQHETEHCNTIQYNTIQYNTILYNTIQYNTTLKTVQYKRRQIIISISGIRLHHMPSHI